MANYRSPGVYIVEENAFPNSAVAVETAIPAFIGYTYKAERDGKSLVRVPTKINSFAEYVESFGGGFRPKFKIEGGRPKKATEGTGKTIEDAKKDPNAPEKAVVVNPEKPAVVVREKEKREQSFKLGAYDCKLTYEDDNELYFFNSIRLFYANGGGTCVILSVGLYGDEDKKEVKVSDFKPTTSQPDGPLELLKNEQEPTLIVMPDVAALGGDAYPLYKDVLLHCAEVQSRFGIFDLKNHKDSLKPEAVIKDFRENIGTNFLNYGAAYYPWLNTSVVDPDELNFENLQDDLETFLEPEVQDIIKNFKVTYTALQKVADSLNPDYVKEEQTATPKKAEGTEAKKSEENSEPKKAEEGAEAEKDKETITIVETYGAKKDQIKNLIKNHHLALKSSSANYRTILNQARNLFNEMPPSAAMAGLYTMVDNTRGVWKAPANYSLNSVNGPIVNISSKVQEDFNVDPFTGKSVNVIRPFQGLGTLVWGGRTLDGNSGDWKYINVRRTLIMIEQSIKAASRAYVFEPNDSNTWITVKAMISNFLTNLWKQGALAGAAPEQAFDVQIGLGSTMTPTDILDGKMLITVKVAVVRPAEFIIITFQQQLQQS